ncbi:hypothetical protein GCM10010116_46360 [Microbispora rosea subsp. aerata]|nr:hypothetical protein GCM10010116_46360 [Microbispora rosea subsp. aerata]GIH58963.1 hypothetical protein Mro02_58770 [Microbispora rosea subsp. aerata]GLJ85828.1 hypothetical protein GCM10017588_45610 [Microbispora rosea subsp. aerata]
MFSPEVSKLSAESLDTFLNGFQTDARTPGLAVAGGERRGRARETNRAPTGGRAPAGQPPIASARGPHDVFPRGPHARNLCFAPHVCEKNIPS